MPMFFFVQRINAKLKVLGGWLLAKESSAVVHTTPGSGTTKLVALPWSTINGSATGPVRAYTLYYTHLYSRICTNMHPLYMHIHHLYKLAALPWTTINGSATGPVRVRSLNWLWWFSLKKYLWWNMKKYYRHQSINPLYIFIALYSSRIYTNMHPLYMHNTSFIHL